MLDNQSNAQNVLLGAGIQSFTGSVSNSDATDYYKLPVTTASNLSLSLSGLTSDINLYLYDNNSKLLASSTNPGNVLESIKIALAPGTYFAKVDLVYPTSNNRSSYKLDFSPNDPLFNNTSNPKVTAIPLVNSIVTQPLVDPKVAAIPIVKNAAPQALVINGVKSSYDANSTLTIDPSYVTDTNGWQDLTKVDFWLTDAQSRRIELADAKTFLANGTNSAKFNYSTSLSGIAVGNYKLNAIAYDKAGTGSNLFDRSLTINPVFTLGFDGTNTNTAYINTFNQVNGTQILGKAAGNVRGITGGTVQDFEKGSIFQSTAGTFALQGTLNNFYNNLSASDKIRLGLPTAIETSMGGYWHQAFQNGDLQLVQGAPVKWSNQTLINERFTLLGGVTSLGNAVGAIRTVNGAPVQDYDKGSIVVVGNNTVAVLGSIATYYRANSATLGLPTSEEVTTSYGKSQTFQGALVTSSIQFGVHTLHGSLVGYYSGLTAAQKDQLGAATTEEALGGDGNFQQFFKGGSVFWKKDGTGEVKLTPFTIGFNGTTVNPTFTTEFNKIVGWEALGKVTSNVRSIAGGTVQDFEKGSIFQSAVGTFAVRGQIGAYYRTDSANLGLPITGEIGTSYGWRQDFASGRTLIHSPQFGTQVLQGSLGNYYRGLSEAQRNQLGAVYTSEKNLGGGNWRQFFAGGTVEWKNNGTGEVKLTPSFSIGLTGNTVNNDFIDKFNSVNGWNALGSPTGSVKTVGGAAVQDFQKGSIFKSAKGTFVLDGILLEMYRQQYSSSIGNPIGDKVSTVNGLRQDFEKGILVSTVTAQTFEIKGAIASYYQGMSDTQLKALGAPINNAGDSNGGVHQYFQNGIVSSSSFGTFTIRGVFSERGNSRGVALGEEKIAGDGLRQDFSEGSATYSAKAGIHEINGGLFKYYQSLTEAQKTQLGVAYTNTWSGGNNAFQFFQGGVVELNRNGVSQVRFTPAIGFDGNTFNAKFFDRYMTMENIDGLGDPIGNVVNVNGILRQDFQKGFITQNGDFVQGQIYGGRKYPEDPTPIAGGGVIIITSNPQPQPSNNGGGVITITSGNGGSSLPSNAWRAEYYNNNNLQGNPTFTQQENSIDRDWGYGGPGNGIGNDNFSVRWQGNFYFEGGTYSFNNSVDDGMRIYVDGQVIHDTWNGRNAVNFSKEQSLSTGWHDVKVEYREITEIATAKVGWNKINGVTPSQPSNPNPTQPSQNYGKFSEGSVDTNTNWYASVYKWDRNQGQPPANFSSGEYNYSPNALAELNLGSNNLGNGRSGISFNLGSGALKGYNDRLPSDNFAVRAYTQANFDGGQYTFKVRGDDGFQIFAKLVNTDRWEYITPKDQWQTSYDSYKEITAALPAGRYDLHFHYFEGDGLARFDLSWGKGGNNTPLPSNNQPNSNSSNFYVPEFTGVVMVGGGINIRSGPGINYGVVGSLGNGAGLSFDGLTQGTSIYDQATGQYDDRWFRIKGTNNWVASALINGNPGRSVSAPQQPTNSGQPPTNGGSSPPNGTSRSFNSSFFREGNIFWNGGFAPVSTGSPNNKLGNAKGNCTWYVNGRLQELGYSTATLNKLSGNAQDWDDLARANGVAISSTPQVGAIAQWENGHVAVVERVNADGTISISESSYSTSNGSAADYLYKEETISASSPTRFIIVPLSGSSTGGTTLPRTGGGDGNNYISYSDDYNRTTIEQTNSRNWTTLTKYTRIQYSSNQNGYYSNQAERDGKYHDVIEPVNIGLYNITNSENADVKPNKKTWVIIHGFEDDPNDTPGNKFRSLAKEIEKYEPGDQILVLNWSQASKQGIPGYIRAVEWIDDVAHLAANKLREFGIAPENINIVGHSLGALLAYKTSEYIANQKTYSTDPLDLRNQVNRLVALDPAALSGYYDSNNVDFKTYSQYSWAFWGSHLSDESIVRNADESFHINFPTFSSDNDNHGKVIKVFTNLFNQEHFKLQKINSNKTRPWDLDAGRWGVSIGYEADIYADKDGNVSSITHHNFNKLNETSVSISGKNT